MLIRTGPELALPGLTSQIYNREVVALVQYACQLLGALFTNAVALCHGRDGTCASTVNPIDCAYQARDVNTVRACY